MEDGWQLADQDRQSTAVLEALHVSKSYTQGRWYSRKKFSIAALNDVSLKIDACSALALIGESGAGKSTLGRCLSRLETPDSGEVRFEGRNLFTLSPKDLRAIRRKIQFVFQDAAAALNPRFSACDAIEEPLLIQNMLTRKERRRRALETMEQVGLSIQSAPRSILEFSGGQRQRLAIARALVLKPRLLLLDEALSSLDFDTQARLTELLLDLRIQFGLSYLFITHDLRLAARVADHIAVMQRGAIVESGKTDALFAKPQHPYTQSLLQATPG